MSPIPFVDLAAQHRVLAPDLRKKLDEILESSQFILGGELERFEAEFATWLGVPHAVGVSDGTAALELACRALVPPGSEVIVPASTFVASAFAVTRAGSTPRFADVLEGSRCLDPAALEAARTPRTRAIVVVHLYGHPAALDEILAFARRHRLAVIEDCAQAHGARYRGRTVGSFGDAACFSFYPSKNLGALGDGGAVTTGRDDVARTVRMVADHGRPVEPERRHEHAVPGLNSRLDALQAAVLSIKLRHLEAWNAARRRVAATYTRALAEWPEARVQRTPAGRLHVTYVHAFRHPRRDDVIAGLAGRGVQARAVYPCALHAYPALGHLGHRPGAFPVAEAWGREVVTLPMFAEMTPAEVTAVVDALAAVLPACR
jgi:dTDP-4-amino-4,6-dideoxygalactose transaminase